MERLKITAISLSITVLTFMFGPLVLSALFYYAYTYCDDRPDEKYENKGISSLYIFGFVVFPFILFFIFKFLGVLGYVFEYVRGVFYLKIFGFYDFYYSGGDDYFDSLAIVSLAHLVSIFSVFLLSIYMAKYRNVKNMGLSKIVNTNFDISYGKRLYVIVVFFIVLLVLILVYYFAFSDINVNEIKFYKDGFFSVIFFPIYMLVSLMYIVVVRV